MAFLQTQFFSDALRVAVTVNVILPEVNQGIGITGDQSGERKLPQVLYLLHGYSDDHSIWMRRTSIERYAASHNLAVIMPAVNHSFYCNEVHGERYWDFVSEELPRAMHTFFRLSDKPEDTYVAGLSMGGYGAMKLALNFPERFAAAASFSGAVDIMDQLTRPDRDVVMSNAMGSAEQVKGSENDLFHLVKVNAKVKAKPRLYIACGTKDFLYHQHGNFQKVLKENGWDFDAYDEPDAIHEWGFWDRQIAYFLEHYVK